MSIRDLRNPWRDALLPASYKGVEFHVEAASVVGGRRLIPHEFPKKERPYVEDMGRRARSYSVRGYVVSFVRDTGLALYQRDYRVPRDLLIAMLDAGGAGRLQLPTQSPIIVACDRYQWTEEQRSGGYATFDMSFVEQGEAPAALPPSTREQVIGQSQELVSQVLANLAGSTPTLLGDVAGARQALAELALSEIAG
jgi:prophage DNA circulation protein